MEHASFLALVIKSHHQSELALHEPGRPPIPIFPGYNASPFKNIGMSGQPRHQGRVSFGALVCFSWNSTVNFIVYPCLEDRHQHSAPSLVTASPSNQKSAQEELVADFHRHDARRTFVEYWFHDGVIHFDSGRMYRTLVLNAYLSSDSVTNNACEWSSGNPWLFVSRIDMCMCSEKWVPYSCWTPGCASVSKEPTDISSAKAYQQFQKDNTIE